jgi:hypothetical protein
MNIGCQPVGLASSTAPLELTVTCTLTVALRFNCLASAGYTGVAVILALRAAEVLCAFADNGESARASKIMGTSPTSPTRWFRCPVLFLAKIVRLPTATYRFANARDTADDSITESFSLGKLRM